MFMVLDCGFSFWENGISRLKIIPGNRIQSNIALTNVSIQTDYNENANLKTRNFYCFFFSFISVYFLLLEWGIRFPYRKLFYLILELISDKKFTFGEHSRANWGCWNKEHQRLIFEINEISCWEFMFSVDFLYPPPYGVWRFY